MSASKNNQDDYLMLSGIQHFSFCKRQWALIHIDQVWAENKQTTEGNILHEKTDDPFIVEHRPGVTISRAMPVVSHNLKIQGRCDTVEFVESASGFRLKNISETVTVLPVEYKRGKPKKRDHDILQLCAQAICLEEMLKVPVKNGALFYAGTKRRYEIEFTDSLRGKVKRLVEQMYALYKSQRTPQPNYNSMCRKCSLADQCLPKVFTNCESAKAIHSKKIIEILKEERREL